MNKPSAEIQADAITVLQVTPEAVASVPQISKILQSAGIRTKLDYSGNEDPTVWDYLESSDERDARALLAQRDLLTAEMQMVTPFEAYCVAAGIPTKKALGLIQAEVFDQAGKAAELLTSASYAAVVQHTVGMALTPNGTKEKEMILKNRGFLPVPKNTVNIVRGNQVNAEVANVAVLPAFDETVRRVGDRFLDRQLAAPVEIVQAEEDDEG